MEQNKIFLYVGCGAHRMKDFTHVEINIAKQYKKNGDSGEPEILADITKHIPLEDSSVDLIFSRATLEHLTYFELINHFLECHRLIKNGGHIRMSVPDMDIMIKNYLNKQEDLNEAINNSEVSETMPLENHTDLFISRILYHDHYYLHNFDTLSRALKKTGFTNIKKVKPGETEVQDVAAELQKAEKGREKWEIMIEAQRLNDQPKIKKFTLKLPNNFILRIFAKVFNIKISKYNNRKPVFPSYLYFLDLIRKLKK
jgi:predicted SAM-dependent methyltransferase